MHLLQRQLDDIITQASRDVATGETFIHEGNRLPQLVIDAHASELTFSGHFLPFRITPDAIRVLQNNTRKNTQHAFMQIHHVEKDGSCACIPNKPTS